jgi:hypothetical protein
MRVGAPWHGGCFIIYRVMNPFRHLAERHPNWLTKMNTPASVSHGEFEQQRQRVRREEMVDEILVIAAFVFLVGGLLVISLVLLGAVQV